MTVVTTKRDCGQIFSEGGPESMAVDETEETRGEDSGRGMGALLVHNREEPLGTLGVVLAGEDIRTWRARSCSETARWLRSGNRPQVLLTDVVLPDGTWMDVLGLVERRRETLSVIVVAQAMDIRLYAEVLQRGVFDFLAPPFFGPDVGHIVRCAVASAPRRGSAAAAAA